MVCQNSTTLLLQLDGGVPERFPHHERRLYVFVCRDRACQRKEGSVLALRASKMLLGSVSVSTAPRSDATGTENLTGIGNAVFSGSQTTSSQNRQNPFTMEATFAQAGIASNPQSRHLDTRQRTGDPDYAGNAIAASFAQKMSISEAAEKHDNGNPRPWPLESELPRPLPKYHLEAAYEALESSATISRGQSWSSKIDKYQDNGFQTKNDSDAYESDVDKVFQRFVDRLAHNPQQVLRYEFGGSPLLYSDRDGVGRMFTQEAVSRRVCRMPLSSTGGRGHVPKCQRCGSLRVVEFQIMPHTIAVLEANEAGVDGMEWGTMIVAVCSDDCCDERDGRHTTYTREWVGVQWEERAG